MLDFFQVALVTSDLPASTRLYHQAFGFENAGGQCAWGSKIQGLGLDARFAIWWLVGQQPFFQLEIFNYTHPVSRPLATDWRPCDHGWTRFGVEVPEFDGCVQALAYRGIQPLGPPAARDGLRRAAVRDPYTGAVIEVIETRSPGRTGPSVPYATSSVSDLEAARSFYGGVLGLELSPLETLHQPSDEALWGLGGAEREGFVAKAGGGLLEIVRYDNPRGRPKPSDWRLSDQGIQNIALGARNRDVVAEAVARVHRAGHTSPYVLDTDETICAYVNDREREIEFAAVPETMDEFCGLKASPMGFFGVRDDLQSEVKA